MVDLSTISAGNRVKIVDRWDPGGACCENRMGLMNKWLGQTMTVRENNGYYLFMEEDAKECGGGGWYWNEHCIDYVVDDEDVDIADEKDLYAFLEI